ncbi:CehA/McbA family metallohydrolase [Akkermansiaceae bacterium]|nr:CehA/McbA family metallohydrolase [Akkermansiaceae bacterium]MDB4422415.1 CehA/McbA family metallohydrolase [bacterium]MDA9831540.1 CehA/McbA family metallohydrolase [Akkermansiaceae bacterium]MDB4383669.1 CehA/McbA family metallohydrolase [Akkermansiaceae bacterium]MDB4466435.1 CehA/McbA family metallohydrolase [bacterium]
MKILRLLLPAGLLVAVFIAKAANDGQAVALNAKRVVEALEVLGNPLSNEEKARLADGDGGTMEGVLDSKCLAVVTINPESRVKAVAGEAKPVLVEAGWSVFLIKVINEAGVTAPLRVTSEQAIPLAGSPKAKLEDRWLDLAIFRGRPLSPTLTGASIDYRIIQLYSRDAGRRAAVLTFDVGQGTQDLGFRSDLLVNFECRPTREVQLKLLDENGKPTTAALEIRDNQGRVYPSQAKRLAPDFHFHPQIYRAHGETVKLPEGRYKIRVTRGPEYFEELRAFTMGKEARDLKIDLNRWVDPAASGWWSGDHHIHAAGCAHYNKPTEGVHAPDMMRHILGEDLKVGANLTWGPCFDYQKQFFTGKEDKVSQHPYLLRYDIEVSGFGSHQSGHLCLLQLKDQMYPGGDSTDHWPTLGLNTLKWAKRQGAVVGPAHSGWGLACQSSKLPNYEIPPFDGIGANEYIVDVTHQVEGPKGSLVPAVDFLSTVDTPMVWELNIWYHTLNVGYRTRISGETDFPCIYGERVGLGRSYVKVDGELTYNRWCEGIRAGRNYVGDGRSHLMDFSVGGVEVGVKDSELQLAKPGKVTARVDFAAWLDKEVNPIVRGRSQQEKPYWHIERARVGDSRMVPVELLVNGYPVARKEVAADGETREVGFEVQIDRSSWVAMRVLGSSHTNPVWVIVDDKPVRASRRSAKWCLASVDQCWSQKERFIAKAELNDAKAAYAHAKKEYETRLNESEVE